MKTLITFLCLTSLFTVYSQTEKYIWLGAGIDWKIGKKFEMNLTEEYRMNLSQDSSNTILQELKLGFKPKKSIRIYVFGRYNVRTYRNNTYLLGAEITLSKRIKESKFKFQYQLRFQKSNEINSFDQSSFIRNRIGFEYNLSKRFDPFIQSELFFRLDGKNEFRFVRNTIGVKINLPRSFDLKLAASHQNEIFVKNPVDRLIFQFSLGYTIESGKNKNEKQSEKQSEKP